MITVSKRIEYSVALVSYLAQKQGKFVSLARVCRQLNLPFSFLGSLASKLKSVGIVESKEGKDGGYGLARGWQDKSLYSLFGALGENKRMVRCLGHGGECSREQGCKIKGLWGRVEKVLIDELKIIKLKEI